MPLRSFGRLFRRPQRTPQIQLNPQPHGLDIIAENLEQERKRQLWERDRLPYGK
jgi:hypothetical protein